MSCLSSQGSAASTYSVAFDTIKKMKAFSAVTRARMSISAQARCTSEWRRKRSLLLATPLDSGVIERMYSEGRTQAEIASSLGVSQKVIWRHMRTHGIGARPAVKRNQQGPNNDSWKGRAVGYAGIHLRCEAERGKPKRCEVCGLDDKRRRYHWANVTGDYTTTKSFVRMCVPCHFKFDQHPCDPVTGRFLRKEEKVRP